ncbi:MAG: hypothetical protein JXN60_05750 [Lentisphaerae bacterium]|nr:hypothetical protein [Lentisphaerota bacterium]
MSNIVKIQCPSCGGNIAIEQPYYLQIVGTVIECSHCSQKLIVPQSIEPSLPNPNTSDLKKTQMLQLVPIDQPEQSDPNSAARFCPHCKVEVGPNDLVCVECENALT